MALPSSNFDLPLVVELCPAPDLEAAFVRLAARSRCVFLDSALREKTLGRYSFLTADPFELVEFACPASGAESGLSSNPLRTLASRLAAYRSPSVPDLPPFQGGAAGLLSYDLGRTLERIPAPKFDEFRLPWLSIGLYDTVLAFDHGQQRAWLISQGFPEIEPQARRERAQARVAQFRDWLSQPLPVAKHPRTISTVAETELAPQTNIPGFAGLTSNFSAEGYRAAVSRAIEYIYAGDIFQVNFAQRLLHPATCNSVELYVRLRQCNPATFAGYCDLGDFQIVSASPERFLKVHDGLIETRPIKGTRRRTLLPEADLFAGDELLESEKDRAENVMIVDLLRNDLSRVCEPDSVRVSQLCRLEQYQFVQHLVSAVEGQLAPGRSALDAVEAAFPGGSITGAPKVRAMEIIAELEPTARGPYCGSLGYLGFDGTLDFNILIRTITAGRGWWQMPVGGGIVAQSSPQREYEETWHKAAGLLRALR
jgi:para-aminobenzoate synthetase component 1